MSDLAQELSDSLAATVEVAGRSVVRVEGRRHSPASGVVFSEDGVVVTAHHVLEWDEEVRVGLADGSIADATLAGRDPGTDLAALRVPAQGLTAAQWSHAEAARVGALVLALSRPGRTVQARLGIVSALGPSWRTPGGGRVDRYLQADLALHPGFSGGALTDTAGRVLGVNTAGLLRGTATALPTATVRRVVDSLLRHGQVRRGYLGIGTQPVRLPAGLEQQLGQSAALLVSSVQPDSPAARAGVLLGDLLASLDGHPLAHAADLLPLLEEERIGAEARARVVRGGEVRELAIVIGTRNGRS